MKLNQFAVYRVDQQTAGKALWHLPYQEARQQNVLITVENYRLVSIHEMQEEEKVADIWKRMKKQCEVSDVLVLNKNGEISYLPNPYIKENLAFSLQMMLESKKYYPDLARTIYLRGYRYNLHLRPKTLLVECGAQTNTVQEEMNAMEPLADILNKVLTGT